MAQTRLDITISALAGGVKETINDVNTALRGGGTASDSFASSYTELMSKIQAGKMVVGIFADTFKKAFEMGREGATILQINSSFDGLMASVGASPATLQLLMDATNQTIDDEEIMGATLRMVAGTSAELTRELISAAPEIMNMAKAANKLNPTMGTTLEQYERLVQGIRTGSERMLRQSGIMVDFQGAYDTYAESIGKAADALTEEEKASANLQAVLGQQDKLLAQVGGTTDSAVDSFDQMNVALGEMKDALLVEVTPALTEAAKAVTILATATDKISGAMDEHSNQMLITSKSVDEYNKEMVRASQRLENFIRLVAIVTMNPLLEQWLDRVLHLNKQLTESEYLIAKGVAEATAKNDAMRTSLEKVTTATAALTAEQIKNSDAFKIAAKEAELAREIALKETEASRKAVEEFNKAAIAAEKERQKVLEEAARSRAQVMEEARVEAERMITALDDMRLAAVNVGLSFGMTANIQNYNTIVSQAIANNNLLAAEYSKLASTGIPATSQALVDLTAKINANNQAQVEAQASLRKTTAEMIYQQASQGLGASESLEMARAFGLIDENSYAIALSIQNLRIQFDKNRDGMISAGEGANKYTQAIIALQAKVQELVGSGLPSLAAALGGLTLPSWLTPGSPTPLETGLRGIASAMGTVATVTPMMGLTSGATGGSSGGMGGSSVIVNINSPVLGFADEYELGRKLAPIIQAQLRGA